MRLAPAVLLALSAASAQTTVYLPDSGPPAVQVMGATASGNLVIHTGNGYNSTPVPHGLNPLCGNSMVCYVAVGGMCAAGTGAAIGNGIREAAYVDDYHLQLQDLTGTNLTANGTYCGGGTSDASAQWIKLVHPYALGSQPLGWLDGPNGSTMRRLALNTQNGLVSLVLSGCPSACVITETLGFDPSTGFGANWPVEAGNHFSVNGTGTVLDTNGDGTVAGGAQTAYTVASTTSSTIVSNPFSCTGCTNSDYANVNLHCGPSATPNDLVEGH